MIDLAPHKAELLYRRLQLSIRTGDATAAREVVDQLHTLGGPYADAADRLLYLEAARAWKRDPADAEARANVILLGSRIIEKLGPAEKALADPGAVTLYATVSEAAAKQFAESGDAASRAISIRLDRDVLQAQPRAEAPFVAWPQTPRRPATQGPRWSAGSRSRLGSRPDPTVVRGALQLHQIAACCRSGEGRRRIRQHKALYPVLAPEPWTTKFEALQSRLPAAAPTRQGGSP